MFNRKIGLLTIHDTLNYGSLLQAYSTYKAIERLENSVVLIDYKCKKINERESIKSLNECHSIREAIKCILWNKPIEKKQKQFWKFMQGKMKLSEACDAESVAEMNRIFDTFIVGSDIVWGLEITGYDFTYFLDFAEKGKKKIAFSSSAGTKWNSEDEKRIQRYLEQFDHISVREQLARDWIQPLVNKNIEVTCDPTMLWTRQDWEKLKDKDYAPKGRYVLIYLRTDDLKNIRDGIAYAKSHGMPAYYINYGKYIPGAKNIKPESVEKWISLFSQADTIFSASYHGLLFGLYFHANVFYYNRGNKSRMLSLGKELGIEYREGTDQNIYNDIPIDYVTVEKVIKEKREYSWEILKSRLQ